MIPNRKLVVFVPITLLILACSFASAPAGTPDQSSVATIVASTFQALTAAAPTIGAGGAGTTVSFQNVSFVIPSGLATGASAKQIPNNPTDQNGGPWGVAPAHLEFTLTGYGLPAGYFQVMVVDVYPAEEYAAMYQGAKISLDRLKAALSSPSMPLTNDNMPRVPFFNADSMFSAQIQRLQFASGSGIRVVTQYGQAVGPIGNAGTFYHFEGLTTDGRYYIIAVLPVGASYLVSGGDPSAPLPAGGIPFPGYNNTDPAVFEKYFKAISDKMNASTPDSFLPSLTTLDALIQSISIH